jgi:hypothetical protein
MSKNQKHPHEELFERLAVQIGPHEHLPETLVVILVQQLQNPHQTGHQAPLENPNYYHLAGHSLLLTRILVSLSIILKTACTKISKVLMQSVSTS